MAKIHTEVYMTDKANVGKIPSSQENNQKASNKKSNSPKKMN
jgi:hypothetical protein